MYLLTIGCPMADARWRYVLLCDGIGRMRASSLSSSRDSRWNDWQSPGLRAREADQKEQITVQAKVQAITDYKP